MKRKKEKMERERGGGRERESERARERKNVTSEACVVCFFFYMDLLSGENTGQPSIQIC